MMGSPVLLVISGCFFILLVSTVKFKFTKLILFVCATVAVLKIFFIGYVAYSEKDSRNYNNLAKELAFINNEDVYVAGDRLIWLAFRPTSNKNIFWLVDSKYTEDYIWRSLTLRGNKLDKDMYIIVDKKREINEMTKDYPIFKDRIQFVKEINCCRGPYNVNIYKVIAYD